MISLLASLLAKDLYACTTRINFLSCGRNRVLINNVCQTCDHNLIRLRCQQQDGNGAADWWCNAGFVFNVALCGDTTTFNCENTHACIPCPTGAHCPGGTDRNNRGGVTCQAGFRVETALSCQACAPSEICLGGGDANNWWCAPGFFFNTNRCDPCPNGAHCPGGTGPNDRGGFTCLYGTLRYRLTCKPCPGDQCYSPRNRFRCGHRERQPGEPDDTTNRIPNSAADFTCNGRCPIGFRSWVDEHIDTRVWWTIDGASGNIIGFSRTQAGEDIPVTFSGTGANSELDINPNALFHCQTTTIGVGANATTTTQCTEQLRRGQRGLGRQYCHEDLRPISTLFANCINDDNRPSQNINVPFLERNAYAGNNPCVLCNLPQDIGNPFTPGLSSVFNITWLAHYPLDHNHPVHGPPAPGGVLVGGMCNHIVNKCFPRGIGCSTINIYLEDLLSPAYDSRMSGHGLRMQQCGNMRLPDLACQTGLFPMSAVPTSFLPRLGD